MKRGLSVVCLCALVSLALVAMFQAGCKAAKSDEVPITTKSKEARRLFVEGRDLYEFGHVEKSRDLLKRAVELDPDFALAQFYYAYSQTETAGFQATLAKAFAAAAGASEGEQKLIAGQQAVLGENDAVKANKLYQELAALFPKDKRVHWFLAGTYGNMQQYDKQLASLEQAIALDKEFAPPHASLGYYYRWRKQFDKAEEAFKEYARLRPEEARSHDNLGDLYRATGRSEEAIKEYEEAVRMDPAFVSSQMKIGSALIFLGRFEEARQAYLKSMDMPVEAANKVYGQEGIMRSYIYEGDYAKALEAADKSIRMAKELGLPEEASFVPVIKSAVYCELGEFDKADASIAEGMSFLDGTDLLPATKANQRAGATLFKTVSAAGRRDFAAAAAQADSYKAQLAAINNPAIQKYAAWLYGYVALAQDQTDKALGYFGEGEMDHPWFLYYHALAKEKAGDSAGAAELYQKVANWNLDTVWYAFVRAKAAAKK